MQIQSAPPHPAVELRIPAESVTADGLTFAELLGVRPEPRRVCEFLDPTSVGRRSFAGIVHYGSCVRHDRPVKFVSLDGEAKVDLDSVDKSKILKKLLFLLRESYLEVINSGIDVTAGLINPKYVWDPVNDLKGLLKTALNPEHPLYTFLYKSRSVLLDPDFCPTNKWSNRIAKLSGAEIVAQHLDLAKIDKIWMPVLALCKILPAFFEDLPQCLKTGDILGGFSAAFSLPDHSGLVLSTAPGSLSVAMRKGRVVWQSNAGSFESRNVCLRGQTDLCASGRISGPKSVSWDFVPYNTLKGSVLAHISSGWCDKKGKYFAIPNSTLRKILQNDSSSPEELLRAVERNRVTMIREAKRISCDSGNGTNLPGGRTVAAWEANSLMI